MLIYNGQIFGEDGKFRPASLRITGDRIQEIYPPGVGIPVSDSPGSWNASGCLIIPGLIDIHTHGSAGREFCDGRSGSLQVMGRYLASQGITTFMPASMTLPEESLADAFRQAASYKRQNLSDRAELAGIYMEGPFFAKEKKGAQSAEYLRQPDIAFFDRLDSVSNRLIRVLCVAPELAGVPEFIARVKSRCVVSLAHTAADYSTAAAAFAAGASLVTHLFNAMNPFGHRQTGVPGAAFDHGSSVELISDGIHLHPAVIRAAFKLYGADRVILVSDSMAACGMADGEYLLGTQQVHVANGEARLANGTIAGSTTCLSEMLRRAVSFGIPPADAIRAATLNPARLLGLADRVGSLAVGKQADLVILDDQLRIVRVLLRGSWYT